MMIRFGRYLTVITTIVSLAAVLTMGSMAQANTCTPLNKCGWCTLRVSNKGANSVTLSLKHANQFSLRGEGGSSYIDLNKFPSWTVGPRDWKGKNYHSFLPIWLRVEKASGSMMVPSDKKLKDVYTAADGRQISRTITGLEPDTLYKAFAYAEYEPNTTSQGRTGKIPFVQICFKTIPADGNCSVKGNPEYQDQATLEGKLSYFLNSSQINCQESNEDSSMMQ